MKVETALHVLPRNRHLEIRRDGLYECSIMFGLRRLGTGVGGTIEIAITDAFKDMLSQRRTEDDEGTGS